MMATGDRNSTPKDVYVKEQIKCLSESDMRDGMKKIFDEKVADSEWIQNIQEELKKALAMDSSCNKSYEELLLEIGGSDPYEFDLTKTEEIKGKISAGLIQSEHLKTMKEELYKEWDIFRQKK